MYRFLDQLDQEETGEEPRPEGSTFAQSNFAEDRAWCKRQLARFRIDDGDWEKAIEINTEILNHTSFSGTRTRSRALGDLGFANYMLGNMRFSESYLEEAISTTEYLISKSTETKTDSDLSSDLSRYYRHVALLHQKLSLIHI